MELAKPPSAILSFVNNNTTLSSKGDNYQPIIQVFEEEEQQSISLNSSSMSQDYHHQAASAGIFGTFSNGFDRSQQEQHQPQIIAQQIQRDKLRAQGFEPPPPLVAIEEEEESGGGLHGYETAGMLSEMFNFPSGAASATELLEHQISANYHHRNTRQPPPAAGLSHDNWYGNNNRQTAIVNDQRDSLGTSHHHHHHHQQIPTSINASDQSAAAAMQLFLMNPSQPARSPSPSPTANSTLHMLLPNPNPNSNPSSSNSTSNLHHQGFHSPSAGGAFGPSSHHQFTWVPGSTSHEAGSTIPGHELGGGTVHHHVLEGHGHGQGLSLSLSSSLQHLEAAKAEEFRMGDGTSGMLFFNQGGGGGGSNAISGAQYSSYKNNLGGHHIQPLHLQGGVVGGQNHQAHVGFGSSSLGVVNVLRTSKYVKAAQELLEEFCSVGRGQFKKNKIGKPPNSSTNPNSNNPTGSASGGGGSSSSSKDLPPLSAADRIEHQRRKVKLLSMLDEVDRRYNNYCEQMQMVVNSFDLVMGFGAAVPYTALAQKAMSRHFRCLKDAIAAQLKHCCELLGEKDAGTSGVTKGETPRLKLLEQSLRQQRAFHQMGMMEQEAWRPQRGLPERSVNILRAWLFEHFLHPYPSDADKHLLARQTGLSRNQVSNWFINARVRLWKPMVEEMYQQESKDEAGERDSGPGPGPIAIAQTPTPPANTNTNSNSITPPTPTPATTTGAKRSEINTPENDPSLLAINTHYLAENQAKHSSYTTSITIMQPTTTTIPSPTQAFQTIHESDIRCRGDIVGADYGTAASTSGNIDDIGSTLIRFGTTTGDVSLTLGLRHAGNLPEKSPFSVRDFGGI